MFSFLKKFASRFTDKPIKDKVGVTFDDEVSFKHVPTKEQKEKAYRQSTNAYFVKDRKEVGGFELDGLCFKNEEKVIRLRHTLSGHIYTLPISLFEILFEPLSEKVEKHG